MASVRRGSYAAASRPPGHGWIQYATVMLGLTGSLNAIDGLVGLLRSKVYVEGASYVFSDLRTWSWVVLVLGVLEIAAAIQIARGSELFRWFGVAVASVNGIAQLLAMAGYPLWSLAAFTLDVMIVYALVVYGGSRLRSAA